MMAGATSGVTRERLPVVAFLWPKADFDGTAVAVPNGFELRFANGAHRQAALSTARDCDYLILASGFGQADGRLLALAPQLKLVQLTGVGFDNVDRHTCAKRGIAVANIPGLNAASVAQLALQFALRLRRPLTFVDAPGEQSWLAAKTANGGAHELAGTVGIVGFGNVGRAVARLFAGIGMRVVRAAREGQDDPAVPALALDTLLAKVDVLVLCLPARQETLGLIDARRVALLKNTACLINVGRGGVVDEHAVARALANNLLAGAAFDVLSEEPADGESPLFTHGRELGDRLLVTPHVAGHTLQSKARNFALALENVQRVHRGDAPKHELGAPE